MQFLTAVLLGAAAVQAHYTFPRLIVNGVATASKDWVDTRVTKNDQGKNGVLSVTSPDIRCYQSKNADQITAIPAGATVHYISSQQVNHPGPCQYYLAKVPEGKTAANWDGSGAVWFKFHTEMPTINSQKQMSWPGQNEYKTTNATIPAATPSGQYLMRVEHIALHMAMQSGGAQFYLSCSQVNITGGGAGTPGPLAAFPGAYATADPGILVNLGALATADAYKPPGPAVWKG